MPEDQSVGMPYAVDFYCSKSAAHWPGFESASIDDCSGENGRSEYWVRGPFKLALLVDPAHAHAQFGMDKMILAKS